MSRAFVKETDADTIDLPDRPVSPHPNFVTAEGFAAIERELEQLDAAHRAAVAGGDKATIAAVQRELRYWTARRASAQVVPPPFPPPLAGEGIERAPLPRAGEGIDRVVQFGATVTVRRDDGRTQSFRIVGEDEAEPSRGTLSHVSPLARALYGKAVGDTVEVAGGAAEILAIG